MKITFKRLIGPEYMLPAMRVTQGRDMFDNKLPSLELWTKMILSEHSSDRSVVYRIYCKDVPYYTHVHFVRHHVGINFNVMSQRHDKERKDRPQGSLIDMFFDANVQALVNISRKRLCYKADEISQDLIKKLKSELIYAGDEYDKVLGKLLMRPCSWYLGYCAEPHCCGRVPGVINLFDVHKSILEGDSNGHV